MRIFVFDGHRIFLANLFCAPCTAAPGETAPPAVPLSYVTVWGRCLQGGGKFPVAEVEGTHNVRSMLSRMSTARRREAAVVVINHPGSFFSVSPPLHTPVVIYGRQTCEFRATRGVAPVQQSGAEVGMGRGVVEINETKFSSLKWRVLTHFRASLCGDCVDVTA